MLEAGSPVSTFDKQETAHYNFLVLIDVPPTGPILDPRPSDSELDVLRPRIIVSDDGRVVQGQWWTRTRVEEGILDVGEDAEEVIAM